MDNYAQFAKFYDAVMGDRRENARIIRKLILQRNPLAKKLLEIACGTGEVLRHLSKNFEVSGLDLSEEMLKIARKKLPGVELFHQDMVKFHFDKKFDAIICVFDSINHVLKFSDWMRVFRNVSDHLTSDGIFLFDINTQKKLGRHAAEPPWIRKFGKHYMFMDVKKIERNLYDWPIMVFEYQKGNTYILHQETVQEVTFPMGRIENALKKFFTSVEVCDRSLKMASKDSESLYFLSKK